MLCTAGDLPPEVSTVCRYYMTGICRRGSLCRFLHPQLVSTQQGYPYAEGPDVQPGTQWKEWGKNITHGFAASPTYTTARHARGQTFSTSRDVPDNFSDFSSSDDSAPASDQSLTTAFKVMAVNESVPSEFFPFYQPEFSQYHSNTVTRCGSVVYPGYYRENVTAGSNGRGPGRKTNAAKKKYIAYKTKPCKFFLASKTCIQGDKCTFIHDTEEAGRLPTANNQDRETKPSNLPPKPRSLLEDSKARNFYPITWRVIGGGVMMGPPCRAFEAGHCPDGAECKLAHEIKIQTPTNDDISQPPSRERSPCVPSLSALSVEPKRRRGSMVDSGSSLIAQDAHQGTSGDATVFPACSKDEEEHPSARKQSSAKNGLSLQHRRTRSMSLPSSPSILRVPRIFAEM